MLIILVGPPGSGKSTLSETLCQAYQSFVRINQDDLGSRKLCEKECYIALRKGRHILIDRCNIDSQQRRVWIDMAYQFQVPVYCIVLSIPQQVLKDRILARENHPTNVGGQFGLTILARFANDLEPPFLGEGLHKIIYLGMDQLALHTGPLISQQQIASPNLNLINPLSVYYIFFNLDSNITFNQTYLDLNGLPSDWLNQVKETKIQQGQITPRRTNQFISNQNEGFGQKSQTNRGYIDNQGFRHQHQPQTNFKDNDSKEGFMQQQGNAVGYNSRGHYKGRRSNFDKNSNQAGSWRRNTDNATNNQNNPYTHLDNDQQ